MSDVWECIKNGQFKEACAMADQEWKTSQSVLALRNKNFALLHLNDTQAVVSHCKQLIEIRNGETDADFVFLGIALWMQGHTSEALEAWDQATRTKYTDSAGGVEPLLTLLYASVRLSDSKLFETTIKRLKKILKKKESAGWPAPLGNLAINKMSATDVFESVSKNPILRERQMCQAQFHIGVQALHAGSQSDFKGCMKKALSQAPYAYLHAEYYLAKFEASKLGL